MLGVAPCAYICNLIFENYPLTFTNPDEAKAMIFIWKSGKDFQKNEGPCG